MTKLIDRFLGAQANDFPAKKKPMTPAERIRQSLEPINQMKRRSK